MNNHWQQVKLGDVLSQNDRAERVVTDQSYRLLGVRLAGQGPFLREEKTGAEIQASTLSIVQAGDFIYSRLFAWRGAFGLISSEFNGAHVSNEFPTFTVDRSRLDSNYLRFYFARPSIWSEVESYCTGTTKASRNRFKEEFFLRLPVPLPTLTEQRRIVARIEEFAAKIEEARAVRRRSIEETSTVLASCLSHLFDYDPNDSLPTGWHWRGLPTLLVNQGNGMTTGPFGTLLQKSEIQLTGIPILGIANVMANKFIPGFTDHVSPEKAESLSSYELKVDDIVVARSGTVGRACLVPEGLDPMPIMSTNLIRLRVDSERFLPRLLCMLFNKSRLIEKFKDMECRGSSRTFFTQKILSKLPLPVPPLSEQRRIVSYLDNLQAKVDAVKKMQEETSKELNALMPSILSRAFSGEL